MTNSIVPSITDEQLAELEAALLDADDDYPLKDLWMAVVKRLRAAETDARRYRFLRDKCTSDLFERLSYESGEVFDSLTDAAMERTP